MTTLGRYAQALQASVRRARREIASRSLAAFVDIYLKHHASVPDGRMQGLLLMDLDLLSSKRGGRLAVAAPRGHAKSTIATLAFPLWRLLYGREQLVVIVSSTAEQAGKLLGHIKREIETNPLLIEDFPELAGEGKMRPWRAGSILLANGCMALSYGTGQRLRGARNGQYRPTLIIADDLEDKDTVASEEQRDKNSDWFRSTLLKAGTPDTNVVVVGTVLHHDSLLAQLLDSNRTPGWKVRRYQAVEYFADRSDLWDRWAKIYRGDEQFQERVGPDAAEAYFLSQKEEMLRGGRALWPEYYSYYALMEMRLREGELAFQAELQNQPLDPAICVFADAKLQYWDGEHCDPQRLIAELGPGEFFGACDPSLGGNQHRGDYSAIIIFFRPYGSKVKYVVAADIARRKPDEIIEKILQYGQMYRFTSFGVEANQFQQVMVDNLTDRARDRGVRMPVYAIKNRSGKHQRIAALEAEVSQGLIKFSRGHQLLMEQLRAFPMGKHDDGPDALEMAVQASSHDPNRWSWESATGHVYYDSKYPNGVPPGPRIGFGPNDTMPDRLP
jgi:predicted phage terminase large subunit-like protein